MWDHAKILIVKAGLHTISKGLIGRIIHLDKAMELHIDCGPVIHLELSADIEAAPTVRADECPVTSDRENLPVEPLTFDDSFACLDEHTNPLRAWAHHYRRLQVGGDSSFE
ncbi:hypothetical protein A5782_09030 [Mycobacterium sp. 852002-40037_SCH5390672]|nr:hypothetical protein A5782_09030 [Mycobacterium sp. 852002-40037_SCH5390672]